MALIQEDFVRCEKCDNPDFKEEIVLTIPKILKPRQHKSLKLEAASQEIRYMCTLCGYELNR